MRVSAKRCKPNYTYTDNALCDAREVLGVRIILLRNYTVSVSLILAHLVLCTMCLRFSIVTALQRMR